ncbi:hypothetical protein [Streptomyces scabiei]|uniref:hypothetical protein n=1 Tax=Streptomyces scabiei TaxID=1930 RepID=UPI0038F78028
MAKSSRTPTPTDSPAAGYCSWHEGVSHTTLLVRVTPDQGSGAGAPDLYACGPCRRAYDLTPVGRS